MKSRIGATVVLVVIIAMGIAAQHHHRVMLDKAYWNLLRARGIGECIAAAMSSYADEHNDHLPSFCNWQELIKPYLIPPLIDDRTRRQVIDALPYYEYSKEVAGKDYRNMPGDGWEIMILTRTRGLPRGTKIEVNLCGVGEITRPPPPFWRRWFRKPHCDYPVR